MTDPHTLTLRYTSDQVSTVNGGMGVGVGGYTKERDYGNGKGIGYVNRGSTEIIFFLNPSTKDGAEHVWAFPSTTLPSSAETET